MATRQKKQAPRPAQRVTAEKVRENYQLYSEGREAALFKQASESVKKLADPSKALNRSVSKETKEELRNYLKDPVKYEKELRGLSRYLYYRSQVYRRLIMYNASMINLEYRSILPDVDVNNPVNPEALKKSFFETAKLINGMNLPLEFLKAYIIAWREDVFYGCAYHDDTGFFILPLDPEYCKVTGIYPTGDLAFDFNMSYFKSKQEQLEMWGEPFVSMYKEYGGNAKAKWQPMPDENCVCLKVNIDDWEVPLPPYMGLFDNLINLGDLADIMAVAERQQVDKLLIAQMETIKNSAHADDFAVDPETAVAYFNKFVDTLPDYVSASISPVPINAIPFGRDQAADVNKLESATKSVLTISGGVQTLCPPEGTTAYTAAIRSDEEYAISSLLPQTQAILNRLASYRLSNPAKIKLLEVTKYTKDAYKAELVKDLNYGSPHLLTLSTLSGFNELETISLAHMNDALGLRELFKPLQTAATQSGDSASATTQSPGRPEKSPDEPLTDAGETSKERREAV